MTGREKPVEFCILNSFHLLHEYFWYQFPTELMVALINKFVSTRNKNLCKLFVFILNMFEIMIYFFNPPQLLFMNILFYDLLDEIIVTFR